MKEWKNGDTATPIVPINFTGKPGVQVPIPDDADELFFVKLFFTDDVLESVRSETNRYAKEYLTANKETLKLSSDFKFWPEDGISSDKLLAFLALTVYMGILKKDLLRSYWTVDSIIQTPFPRSVMSRRDFFNILSFLHCCNNANYPAKGEIGYDPRKKLGMVFSKVSEKFASAWIPQHVAIDEGTIPFKGSIHFKVYNPNKPDKYGIKTWKLCDSSNSYCCQFDIYVAYQYPNPSKYGKTYDLVMRFLDPYKNLGYIAFMDNFYSSYNLLIENKTASCGTTRSQ